MDMSILFKETRQPPAIPVNSPEYHALVPAVILTAYRNLGGAITSSIIKKGIDRHSK
jgi:hypothetical protein